MIIYNSLFDLFSRVHGSALYKGMLPGLVSCGLFAWLYFSAVRDPVSDALKHPAEVGIVINIVTFIMLFRANYAYLRYIEASSAVHQFMGKWLDATTHARCFHMQQSHYDPIKPPSFYDHPDLNRRGNLTVDRSPSSSSSQTPLPDEETYSDEPIARPPSPPPRRSHIANSIEYVPPQSILRYRGNKAKDSVWGIPTTRMVGTRLDGGWGKWYCYATETDDTGSPIFEESSATVDTVQGDESLMSLNAHFESLPEDLPEERTHSSTNRADWYKTQGFANFPPLVHDTIMPHRPPSKETTPPLFLQELVHLSSLLSAVALSSLRNDSEEVEAPLDVYIPGSQWPPADPDFMGVSDRKQIGACSWLLPNLRYWLLMDRGTKYNATRPLLVLGGVSDAEILFLQRAKGPSAKTALAHFWLTEFMTREHLAGSMGTVGPPIVSRLHQFLSDGMIFYNHARKITVTPFPFIQAQLSVFCILVIMIVVPLLMLNYVKQLWAGFVLVFFCVSCLAGLHEVAKELENPFRNVPNDLPLCTLQAMYNESLVTLFAGYHPDSSWDPDQYLTKAEGETTTADATKKNNTDTSLHKKETVVPKQQPPTLSTPREVVIQPEKHVARDAEIQKLIDIVHKGSQELQRMHARIESQSAASIHT
eukprot:CAMPEP_0198283316 /NCGR_PEP_ID=MMETSP1449-20131203/2955_1 /TAXON_ID=420275 /ORGANISM="Attheya septentrionalis, Strain CCMP2084" /LENGTH=647 /DNA_ID=CAMNT_0043979897 /DNA_START=270 /DNA_END=2213 /DNA_ORIENTATION=-